MIPADPRPVSPEAAPPRATTPEPMTGPFMEKRRAELWQTMPEAFPNVPRDVLERSIEAQVHFELGIRVAERRASIAVSPSRASGAPDGTSGIDQEGAALRSANQQQEPEPSRDAIMRALLTPDVVEALSAECEHIGAQWAHIEERVAEARVALARLRPPFSPEMDRDGLYYPLLFLVEAVEAYQRDIDAPDSRAGASVPAVDQRPQGAPSRSIPNETSDV